MHTPKHALNNRRLKSILQTPAASTVIGLSLLISPVTASSGPWPAASAASQDSDNGINTSDLRRLENLRKRALSTGGRDWYSVMQLYASAENELGLYNEALRDFPLVSPLVPKEALPETDSWQKTDAVEAIAKAAASTQVVFINEAHHDAHTRVLTLELLPRLYATGYRYLAIEALAEPPVTLAARGYALESSGSEYLREPIYGEIVRQAIALGYKVISYDADTVNPVAREQAQAQNLEERIFRKDPSARVIVHAGYAHIDKGRGELGSVTPLAAQLEKRLNLHAVSVNQTQFRETLPEDNENYRWLMKEWDIRRPTVFINKKNGSLWSAKPRLYDVNVVLPRTGRDAVLSGGMERSRVVTNTVQRQSMLAPVVNTSRPSWIALGGARRRLAISSSECRSSFPCLVQANYSSEPTDAVAADRYVFFQAHAAAELYLYPAKYRLIYTDMTGRVITDRNVIVH